MQYRALPAQSQNSPIQQRVPHTARASSFSTAYSAGFQSAPLTAPVDFHLPRTPNIPREFENSQMSAPIAPTPDFNTGYNQGQNQSDTSQQGQGRNDGGLQQQQQQLQQDTTQQQQQQQQQGEEQQQQQIHSAGFLRSEEYLNQEKRKRSYTLPQYPNP